MSDPKFWLTTGRLAQRHFTAADLDCLITLYSDGDVMKYVSWTKDARMPAEL